MWLEHLRSHSKKEVVKFMDGELILECKILTIAYFSFCAVKMLLRPWTVAAAQLNTCNVETGGIDVVELRELDFVPAPHR